RGGVPDPAPLLVVGRPVVLAHGERRRREPIVESDPPRVIAVHHVEPPAPVSRGPELAQVPHDVLTDATVGVGDVTEALVAIRGAAMPRVLARALLASPALLDGRVRNPGGGVLESLVRLADRPGAPVWMLEVRPARQPVAVIDDDIRDRFDATLEQRFEHRPVLREGSIAVVQSEVLFGVVAGAELPGERRGRQPDQIEPPLANRDRVLAHDPVP